MNLDGQTDTLEALNINGSVVKLYKTKNIHY